MTDDPLEVLRAALPDVEPMAGDPAFPLASGVGYLAYEAAARWERVPVPAADPLAHAGRGLPPAVVGDRVRPPRAGGARGDPATGRGREERLAEVAPTLSTPADGEVPATFAAAVVPAEIDPEARARYERGVAQLVARDPRRRDAPGGARAPLQRANAEKRHRDLSVPAPDQPLAVPVLPRPRRRRAGGRRGGRLAGAAGPRPRRRGRDAADRRDAAAPRGPGADAAPRGGAARRPEGAGRARHARRPRAQRRRPRGGAGERRGHHAARRRALHARHAPGVGGPRSAGRGPRRLRRGARHLPGRARSAARRRCGPCRRSPSSRASGAARTPGRSATSRRPTSSAPSPSGRPCIRDGIATVHAGAGIVADSVPEREAAEVAAKAASMLAAIGGPEA